MGLALEEPTENDVVETINGVVVAFDRDVVDFTGDTTLDIQNGGLVMVGGASCC